MPPIPPGERSKLHLPFPHQPSIRLCNGRPPFVAAFASGVSEKSGLLYFIEGGLFYDPPLRRTSPYPGNPFLLSFQEDGRVGMLMHDKKHEC
ncbi:Hypothetical protein GbCGDNIH9_8390 [Granulibacter bethesdensis]|uniref:Uncharacterized protein n=1 Tax=Granulibacter bethesdensis TaxID=364410 RepID=A0AAC9K8G2_9PROT|nr:Hypothetical protein GbCGDNIH9_8390 [Granulibacter bethesdensis]APH60883.1 Hypothetical protein GbCGDNIH8_8390 [Granulibacter bethesdensis]